MFSLVKNINKSWTVHSPEALVIYCAFDYALKGPLFARHYRKANHGKEDVWNNTNCARHSWVNCRSSSVHELEGHTER
jgi:hypothetical protein